MRCVDMDNDNDNDDNDDGLFDSHYRINSVMCMSAPF